MDTQQFNIFGETLSEVTTDDVKAFCDKKNREGINLDYKRDFSSPKKIAKTIAAMANTLGGWIIVGVEDDGDDKPKLPTTGIAWEEQLESRVTNLVIDNILPPSLPIVHVCSPDKDNKTFVIIYVQESKDAPHWLFNENKLCVRVADRTASKGWERLASEGEAEYLRKKRVQSLRLYETHKKLLEDLFDAYDYESEYEYNRSMSEELGGIDLAPIRLDGWVNTEEKLNIVVSPKYPTQQLFNVSEAKDILEEIKFKDSYGTNREFPFRNLNAGYEPFQRGAHIYYADKERENVNFFSLNQFGMFMFKQKVINHKNNYVFVRLDELLVEFKQNLLFAQRLYSKLNYLGIISINVLIDGESWMRLIEKTHFDLYSITPELRSPLPTIDFATDTSLIELSDPIKVLTLIQEFYDEIANSFRWEPMRRIDLQDILKPFSFEE